MIPQRTVKYDGLENERKMNYNVVYNLWYEYITEINLIEWKFDWVDLIIPDTTKDFWDGNKIILN